MPNNPQTREDVRETLQRAWNDWQTLPAIDFTPAEANHIASAILARHAALSTVNVDEASKLIIERVEAHAGVSVSSAFATGLALAVVEAAAPVNVDALREALEEWDEEASPQQRAQAIVDGVEWAMNNCMPAKGESGASCERRRMVEAIASELSDLRATLSTKAPLSMEGLGK